MNTFLHKEDYEEQCCPFVAPDRVESIPTARVIGKLDEYLGANDYPAARRHLDYWMREAESAGDKRGRLTVLNEQIGLYRKLGEEENAMRSASEAMDALRELELDGTLIMGTTLVNAATACKAFNRAAEALPMYERAREIYESSLPAGDTRLAGLYNNMALALTDLRRFDEAETLFVRAMEIMAAAGNGEAEMAITCCNLADLAAAKLGPEEADSIIAGYLDRAYELLSTPGLARDGYYAFVCEKCAPTFGYYGYFFAAQELKKRAEEIYERA